MTLAAFAEILGKAVAAKAKPVAPAVDSFDNLVRQDWLNIAGAFGAFFDTLMLDEVTPMRVATAAVGNIDNLLRDGTAFALPPGLLLNTVDKELKDDKGNVVIRVRSEVSQWDFKLGGDDKDMWESAGQRGLPLNRPVVLREAYKKYRQWKGELPGWAPAATPDEEFDALRWSSALEGFFIRILAAAKAAERAHVSLAQALALYRTEGNLVVPMSANHALNGLPPIETGLKMFHGNWPKIGGTMQSGLWSWPGGDFGGTPLPENDMTRQAIRTLAFADWCIAIVGFDFLIKSKIVRPGMDWVTNVMSFSEFAIENRTSLKVPYWTDRVAVNQELIGPFKSQTEDRPGAGANLQILKWPTTAAERYVVAPRDPAALISVILTEALVFQRALANGSKHGPLIKPPSRLEYMAFHSQDTIDPKDPTEDLFTWILVSAAVAAKTLHRPIVGALVKFKPLSDSLQDGVLGADAIRNKLDFDPVQKALSVKNGGLTAAQKAKFRSQHVDVYNKLKAANWWDDPTHMSDLADFIMEVGENEWGAFMQHRANVSRYARLVAFYEWLTA
jgi:hypothetical protein